MMRKLFASALIAAVSMISLNAQTPLHQRGEGVNFRILDDNIWNYSKPSTPEAWTKLGADPRPTVRMEGYKRLVSEWGPDVICFQEYTRVIDFIIYPWLQSRNYSALKLDLPEPKEPLPPVDLTVKNKHPERGTFVWTPIFYNTEVLEPVYANYVLYTPKQWSDAGSKGFVSAVFIHKASGRYVAVINTHLWWKRDQVEPGSEMARTSQACLMMAEADAIAGKFGDCPVFVTGDMNTTESKPAIQTFFNSGFKPCYAVATEFGDTHSGHHWCDNNGFSVRKDEDKRSRSKDAIDHCLVRDNTGVVEVTRFDCVMDEYTVCLTDHYPNIVDAKIK